MDQQGNSGHSKSVSNQSTSILLHIQILESIANLSIMAKVEKTYMFEITERGGKTHERFKALFKCWGEWSLVRDHSAVKLWCFCFRWMVSNQTAFPATIHERRERQTERGERRRWLIDFDLAMHCFLHGMGLYIRGEEETGEFLLHFMTLEHHFSVASLSYFSHEC